MAKSKTKDSLESLEKKIIILFLLFILNIKLLTESIFSFYCLFFSLLKIFLRGFLCAALDVLELALRTRLTSN